MIALESSTTGGTKNEFNIVTWIFSSSSRIEKVWSALTDSSKLAKWITENDFKPVVGHTFSVSHAADRMGGMELLKAKCWSWTHQIGCPILGKAWGEAYGHLDAAGFRGRKG